MNIGLVTDGLADLPLEACLDQIAQLGLIHVLSPLEAVSTSVQTLRFCIDHLEG